MRVSDYRRGALLCLLTCFVIGSCVTDDRHSMRAQVNDAEGWANVMLIAHNKSRITC